MKKFLVNCLASRLAVVALLIGAISLLSNHHTAQAQTLPCNPDDTKADVTVTHCLVVLVRDEEGYPIANLNLKFLSQIYKVQPSQTIADLGEAVTNNDGKAAIDVTGWPLTDVYSLGLAEPFPSSIQQNSKLLPNRQLRGQDLMWPDFGLRGIPNQNENMVKFVLISTSEGGWFTLDTSYAGFALPHPNSTGPDGSDSSGGGGNADPGKGVITGTAYVSISQYQATLAAQTAVVARAQTAVAQMTPLNGGGGSSNNGSGNSLTPRSDRVGAGTPTPTYLPGYTPGLYNNYKQVSSSATVTNTNNSAAVTDGNTTAVTTTTLANGNTPVAITPTPFYRVATTPVAVAGLSDTTAASGLISSNGVVASNNNNGSDANNSATTATNADTNNANNSSNNNDQPLYVTILEGVVALLLIVMLLSWGKLAKWLRRNSSK